MRGFPGGGRGKDKDCIILKCRRFTESADMCFENVDSKFQKYRIPDPTDLSAQPAHALVGLQLVLLRPFQPADVRRGLSGARCHHLSKGKKQLGIWPMAMFRLFRSLVVFMAQFSTSHTINTLFPRKPSWYQGSDKFGPGKANFEKFFIPNKRDL